MNYEFWVAAERFLYTSLFLRMIILGLIYTLLFQLFLYKGFKNKKKSNLIFFIVIVISIVSSLKTTADYNKYKELYDYEQYVNYAMRDNKKAIIGYHKAPYFEKNAYNKLYLLEHFRKVSLYDETIVEDDDVEFLGREGDNFYFKNRNDITYRKLGDHLEIVDNIEKPIRQGAKFKLKDPKFQDIGFKEESIYVHLLTYKIPKSMANKKFENPKNIETLAQGELLLGWVNPTFKNQISKPEKDK